MSLRAQSARIRTEAAFLTALVAGAWVASAVFGLSRPSAAQATAPVSHLRVSSQAETLGEADRARQTGDLAEADRLYRIAWQDPRLRTRAAESLRSLEREGHEPPIDENQLAQTSTILGSAFRQYETDHFVMLSDAPRGTALAKLQALERAHHQFFRAMDRLGFEAVPAQYKLLCVLFKDHAMYRAFASAHDRVEAGWVAGYYAGLSNRAVFYEDNSGPGYAAALNQLQDAQKKVRELESQAAAARRARELEAAKHLTAQAEHLHQRIASERARLHDQAKESSISKTIHEAIHLLAFNTGVQSRAHEYPFWLTEGLATAFETDRPNAAFGPDRQSTLREQELAEAFEANHILPLHELVSIISPPSDDSKVTEAVYAQAWSLFTFLHRTERRGIANFLEDIRNEAPGRLTPDRRLALFERSFGDVRRLEIRWLNAVGKQIPAVAQASD